MTDAPFKYWLSLTACRYGNSLLTDRQVLPGMACGNTKKALGMDDINSLLFFPLKTLSNLVRRLDERPEYLLDIDSGLP